MSNVNSSQQENYLGHRGYSIYKNKSFPYLIGSLGFIILSYLLIYPGLSNFVK